MRNKSGRVAIIIGISFFLLFILSLFDEIRPTDILRLFWGLLLIITGIFEYTTYYNKNLYRLIMVIIMMSMWIVFYRFSLCEDTLIFVFVGITTLFTILMMYLVPRELKKCKKESEQQNEVKE